MWVIIHVSDIFLYYIMAFCSISTIKTTSNYDTVDDINNHKNKYQDRNLDNNKTSIRQKMLFSFWPRFLLQRQYLSRLMPLSDIKFSWLCTIHPNIQEQHRKGGKSIPQQPHPLPLKLVLLPQDWGFVEMDLLLLFCLPWCLDAPCNCHGRTKSTQLIFPAALMVEWYNLCTSVGGGVGVGHKRKINK